MTYEVYLARSAIKDMRRLPQTIRRRVDRELLRLEEQPYGGRRKKLAGEAGYRAVVGAYRILYEIDDDAKRVTVTAVRHRREAYR